MLLLAIETATDVCGVALHDGARLLADVAVRVPRSHAARLAPMIADLLDYAGAAPGDLDAVAVSAGPGSYTGLRIGASTAKGLAYAADAALVAVPSLEAMARAAGPGAGSDSLVVAFPSRRGEVYAALFHPGADGLVLLQPPAALALTELPAWVPAAPSFTLAGPAAEAAAGALVGAKVRVLDAEPSARAVAEIGVERLRGGRVENAAAWEPYYLKAFVAGPPRSIFGEGEREKG